MEEKYFGELFIMSCGARSWYKDKIGDTVVACFVGIQKEDGTFVLKYPYDYEMKGGIVVLKKPYSLIDVMFL